VLPLGVAQLHGEPGIALDDLSFEFGRFAFVPKLGAVSRAVKKGTAVGAVAALDRARNTDKLGFEKFAGDANDGVAVSAHINEGKMRRERRVGERAGFGDITALCVFEAGLHAVAKQQVYSGLRPGIGWALAHEQRAERMIFREIVFEGFHQSGSGD